MTEQFKTLFLLLLPATLAVATACKGPETIVITENPTPSAPDTTEQQESRPSAAFRQINVGEINDIPSLDPLLADNAATMRALQLVYEGLVRYDRQGNVVPAAAKGWTVSADSLRYTFTLHDNIYYHESDVFPSGIGRKMVSGDVKFVFERMARRSVPGKAAKLFMSIDGFEPYYREQHQVYLPGQRSLRGVKGITTPDDSTVVFSLTEKDPRFLHKLASPYAVIYPREAVEPNPADFQPVGSGPYAFSRRQNDSLLIFSKFKNYHVQDQPVANRIDVSVIQNEHELYKAFARGDLHLIPEPALQISRQVINDDGELISSYADRYKLAKPGGKTTYALHYNPGAAAGREKARYAVQLVDSTFLFSDLPEGYISFKKIYTPDSTYRFSSEDTLTTAFTGNFIAKQFIGLLAKHLNRQGARLQISPVRVPTRNTGLFTSVQLPLYPGDSWNQQNSLLYFTVPHRVLMTTGLSNIAFNAYPWWINMREATIPVEDQF